MKRHQQILLGVLVIQIILGVVVFWPRQAATVSDELLLPDVEAEDIVALTIEDNVGAQISLRKVDDVWGFADADNYPALETAITPVLEKLASLHSDTVVARTESSHKQLEVTSEAFQRRIDLETAGGETYTVYLGTAPRYSATHFRVDGQPEVYLTTELSTWEFGTAASTWAETSYVNIDPDTVTGATLENAAGSFVFVKDDTNWILADLQEDEEPSITDTNAIVRNAATLNVQKPLGTEEKPSYGMDNPSAVVVLTTDDGAEHVLTVGSMNAEDNTYVVKSSSSDYYVSVASYSVSSMVDRTREDFVEPPPTPAVEGPEAPTPTPSP